MDLEEFLEKMELEAERMETEFVNLFKDDPENTSKYPKVPIFDFRPEF